MKRLIAPVAIGLSLALSACTPEMPPDVAAELADRYINCIAGAVSISASPVIADAVDQWISDTTSGCPAMSVTTVEPTETSDVFVGPLNELPTSCTVVAQAPVAIDAVVPAIYSENFDSVVLTPELLHSVLTGEVTSWDDPAIVELNPDASLPTEPIVVALSAQARQAAFASWMSRIEGSTWSGSADLTFGSQIADADLASTEGVITLTSSFIAADQGLSVVGLVTPDFPDGFFPDDTNFGTGASQIVGQRSEDVVSVQLDPTVTAVAQQGVTDVAKPWQALTPIDVTVCAGSNVAPSRALARNMVRLNAQGQLVSLGLQVLPESVRALSSSALGTGLPVPTTMPTNDAVPAATDAPTEAPTDISPSADPTEIATPEPSAS